MGTKSESKENLVPKDNDPEKGAAINEFDIGSIEEYFLNEVEKRYLLAAEWGDTAGIQTIIDENKSSKDFNINCVDPLNRSALITAIENENFELIQLLLEEGIQVGDALLHAISEEYVEAVEELLQWEEANHKEGELYSWEKVDRSKSDFTPDITPLILAAHRNNYEILKTLLDRGATLPMPHDVKCGCDECIKSQESDSLRHSQSRINAYRALSASSLIALSSKDPVLTAFELSWELKRLQYVESEFRAEYSSMRGEVQEFVSTLLDHVRTSKELDIMLNFNHELNTDVWTAGQRQTLERLKLAIKYKQKSFVAHPNVQQLLAAIWYDGLPGFRRKSTMQQIKEVGKLGCCFPIYSMHYILAPNSEKALFMKKPFVKFIMHSTSYMFFLMLLGASSLRFIEITFELIAFPWMLALLDEWRKYERGSLPGPIELGIIMYITSQIFGELKSLWDEGLMDYLSDLWNIVDFISNSFYVTWIMMRITSWIIVHRDLWYRNINPYFPRENWHMFDPMLIAEGAFAAAMIFSFLKLVHIFSINPHLGPLQVSLGRMIIDIIKFFFIYTLVLFAFGCGFNQLLMYYADLEKKKCYHLHPDVPDFDDQEKSCTIWRRFANLFETSQSLFWASFGLVDLVSFELAGIKEFTRFWGLLMFGSYSMINIIVLLNMLIAMMSNSYQVIYEKADTEWKFARSKLWMSYFEDGGTLPPPFNMCPSIKNIQHMFGKSHRNNKRGSLMRRTYDKANALHAKVMSLLVKRYVTSEQQKRDEFGVTEDDIVEVRADISSFRYELLDILKKNKMKVPDLQKSGPGGTTKKAKEMERRIMKDFQIGFVEKIASEMQSAGETKDVFSSIAKVIGKGKRDSLKKKDGEKRNWNQIVKDNFLTDENPIGSRKNTVLRRDVLKIRREILEERDQGLQMDTDKIVQYNPKLSAVAPATRVAYVKFMEKKLVRLQEEEEKEPPIAIKPSVKLKSSLKPNLKNSIKPDAAKQNEKPKNDSEASKTDTETPAGTVKKAAAPVAPGVPPLKSSLKKLTSDTKPEVTDEQNKKESPENESKGTKSEENKTTTKDDKDKSVDSSKKIVPVTTSAAGSEKKKDEDASAKETKSTTETADKKAAEKTDDKASQPTTSTTTTASTATTTAAKPPVPKSSTPGQSTAAAGATGDRGKSTVTGRMISGWL